MEKSFCAIDFAIRFDKKSECYIASLFYKQYINTEQLTFHKGKGVVVVQRLVPIASGTFLCGVWVLLCSLLMSLRAVTVKISNAARPLVLVDHNELFLKHTIALEKGLVADR